MSAKWPILIGAAVSAFLVYWMLNNEEIEKTAKILRKVQERERARKLEPEEEAAVW